MIHLISWNIAGRVAKATAQAAALADRQPDIVAMQEVRKRALPLLLEGLCGVGLTHAIDNIAFATEDGRPYGLMVVSRWPLQRLDQGEFDIPWLSSVLSAVVQTPTPPLELHTAHVPPGSSNGWRKIETLEGIHARLTRQAASTRVLCGDFNTPQVETVEGRVVTWAERKRKDGRFSMRSSRGDRWDKGERQVITGLADYDMPDVFRGLHGYGAEGYSWVLNRAGANVRRRFDHVFASRDLNARECRYLHEPREQKLSDHSPIEAIFHPTDGSAPQ